MLQIQICWITYGRSKIVVKNFQLIIFLYEERILFCRCMSPDDFKGKRMVHWYQWTDQVFCNNPSSRMVSEKFQELLASSKEVTLKLSNISLLVLVMITVFLFVLIMMGVIMKRRAIQRRSRINRRF